MLKKKRKDITLQGIQKSLHSKPLREKVSLLGTQELLSDSERLSGLVGGFKYLDP